MLVVAQLLLTIISAVSSQNLVDDKTQQAMSAELRANNSEIEAKLKEVEILANSIAISVANSYSFTDWEA